MAQHLWTNLDRHLAYCLSEQGEVMTLNESAGTIGTKKAVDGLTVLSAGTSETTAKPHIAPVDRGVAVTG